MTDKQQTAVQWFANQLGITTGTMLEQALAMEREQRIEDMRTAFYKGVDAWMQNPDALESIFNELINK